MLENRDYTLIIDKSGSMSTKENGKSRWERAKEGTIAFANKIEDLDPDGITLYTFASSFRRYENVKAERVAQVWEENEPNGSTDLAAVLTDALSSYFKRKAAGQTKPNGELIIVVTDGAPDNRIAVEAIISDAANRIDVDSELAIGFIQIGSDSGAAEFLQHLDDDLQTKFDIVDTIKAVDCENMTMSEVLLKFIND